MAKENEYTPSDALKADQMGQREETAPADDPLVELARIVSRNKPSGGSVTNDRVGTTDYFAGLDDFSDYDSEKSVEADPRREPHVEPVQNEAARSYPDYGSEYGNDESEYGAAGHGASSDQAYGNDLGGDLGGVVPGQATEDETYEEAPVSRFQADLRLTEEDLLSGPTEEDRETHQRYVEEEADQSGEGFPALEDELIGAFRSTFDANRRPGTPAGSSSFLGLEPREPYVPHQEPRFDAPAQPEDSDFHAGSFEQPGDTGEDDLFVEPEHPQTGSSASTQEYSVSPDTAHWSNSPEPVEKPAKTSRELDDLFAELGQLRSSLPGSALSDVANAPRGQSAPSGQAPAARAEPTLGASTQGASLSDTYEQSYPDEAEPAAPDEAQDTLTRGGVPQEPEPIESKETFEEEEVTATSASVSLDIDDMAWPAAASQIPDGRGEADAGDEEDAPPPGGYDLEAVARAMHESDPTIGRSGVLPPHSAREETVAAKSRKKSSKGLMTAVAVLAVVVVGGAGYAFLSGGETVDIPSGPPPVIAGLEGPLKVVPEQQAENEDSGAKLIYDRVDGTSSDTSRERLILPERTEPAELPPAPDKVVTTDPLVPGGPKRVRTLVVRPDGTIVTEGSASDQGGASQDTDQASAQLPASGQATPTKTISPADTVSRDTTELANSFSQADDASSATPEPAAPVTSTETAALDAAETAGQGEPVSSEPVEGPANAQTIVPSAKPAVPARVASAAPSTSSSAGPLVLGGQTSSQPSPQPSQPVASAPASGSIPAGTYVVQVTSQRSDAAARASFADLQRRFPQVLGNVQAVIVPAEIDGRGTFYRARIPATSREAAISLCENLQAAGGDCFVRRN